jgi:hypothetical protein
MAFITINFNEGCSSGTILFMYNFTLFYSLLQFIYGIYLFSVYGIPTHYDYKNCNNNTTEYIEIANWTYIYGTLSIVLLYIGIFISNKNIYESKSIYISSDDKNRNECINIVQNIIDMSANITMIGLGGVVIYNLTNTITDTDTKYLYNRFIPFYVIICISPILRVLNTCTFKHINNN